MPSISEAVRAALSAAAIDGPRLALVEQLDRKLYTETNKVLEAAGGKWDRKAKAHVFRGPAADAIEPILLTGEYVSTKQEFGQFDTPPGLAACLVSEALVSPGMRVLEPSAGVGRIAIAAREAGADVLCVEIDQARVEALVSAGLPAIIQADFLSVAGLAAVDAVVMNPPFAKQADIDHVMHAFKFLKPEGRLVAITSAGVLFREDRKSKAFRAFVDDCGGSFERLPSGSFKSSGTMVEACVVKLSAPKA